MSPSTLIAHSRHHGSPVMSPIVRPSIEDDREAVEPSDVQHAVPAQAVAVNGQPHPGEPVDERPQRDTRLDPGQLGAGDGTVTDGPLKDAAIRGSAVAAASEILACFDEGKEIAETKISKGRLSIIPKP